MIFAYSISKSSKTIQGAMHTFPYTTRIYIRNKQPVEKGIQNMVDGMVEHAIFH